MLEYQTALLGEVLDRVGAVRVLRLTGSDLGTQRAPMIDPDVYRALVWPRYRKLWDFVRSRTRGQDLLPLLRQHRAHHPAPHRGRRRCRPPGAAGRRGHGRPGQAQARVRRRHHLLGRLRPAAGPALRDPRRGPRGGASACSTTSCPAVASSSRPATTSRPTCRRRTSSRCSTRCSRTGATEAGPAADGRGRQPAPRGFRGWMTGSLARRSIHEVFVEGHEGQRARLPLRGDDGRRQLHGVRRSEWMHPQQPGRGTPDHVGRGDLAP